MGSSIREKLYRATNKVFQRNVIIVAGILLILVLCGYVGLKNVANYEFSGNSIVCSDAAETAVMSDGSTLVSDGTQNVFCFSKDGKMKFKITMKSYDEITGITVDADDNIYAYISKENKGGTNVLRDEITRFNSKGEKIKVLSTIDYSTKSKASDVSVRTSPLRYQNGYLCYTVFKAKNAVLYKVNVNTGKRTKMGNVKSTAIFAYTDVEPNADGSYYYIKATGEIGYGKLGDGQKVLCSTSYNIKSGKGIRPFYVRNVGDNVYVMDYWAGLIYKVSDGKLVKTTFKNQSAVKLNQSGVYTNELNTCSGKLCGITDGTPWYIDNGTLSTLKDKASVSIAQVIVSKLGHFIRLIGLPFMIADIIFIILAFIWIVIRYGKHFFWKLIASFMLIFIVFMIASYLVFSNEQQAYLNEYLKDQKHQAILAVNTLNSDEVSKLNGSSDMAGKEYNKINAQLISDFSIYQKDSDTAAILFVADNTGKSNIMVASNRGFGGLLGGDDFYDQIINSTGNKESYGTLNDDLMISCAAVKNDAGKVVGHLIIYTAVDNISNQFLELWSIPIISISLILILLSLLISSTFVSKTMRRISMTIKGIIGGDYSIRIPNLPNDEIGEVGQCVNTLSQNIETLIAENTRQSREIQKSQEEVLISLASITEAKSGQTATHVRRVSQYVSVLATELGYDKENVRYISTASMLHDVGKLITPNEILEKPGKLTAEEFERMKTHTTDGERLLHNGSGVIMGYARIIAMQHHEKWDGSGYPRGLKGDEIDLTARITALADVFDALVSKRSYKDAMSTKSAYDIIVSERGHHFDPKVVDVFIDKFPEFCRIAAETPDEE